MRAKGTFDKREAADLGLDDFALARDVSRMMRHVMMVLLVIGLVSTAILLTRKNFDFTGLLGALIALFSGIGLILQRFGYVKWVVVGVIWSGWLLVSLWIYLVMGVRTPGLYAYPVFIMLTGWLMGRTPAVAMSVLSVANLVVAYWLEATGKLQLTVERQPFDYLIVGLAVIALATVFAVYVSEGFRRQYRRQLELAAALRHRVEELRNAEAKAAQLFYQNPLPCMVTRLSDGVVCDVNLAWERNLGWQRHEALGRSTVDFGFWDTSEEREALLDGMLEKRQLAPRSRSLPVRSGEMRVYLISTEVIDVDGERRLLNSMFDQTQRLQAEEEVRQMNLTLEAKVAARTAELTEAIEHLKATQEELLHSEKLASLGSLVAGISHDLNTPIGNALTVASTLQQHVQEVRAHVAKRELKKSTLDNFLEASGEMSDLLVRACRRAAELVASFKQVAADQASERRRQFDLKEVVEDVLATLRPTFKHQPWQLECDIPPGIACDSFPGPLGQVVSNLIQNACMHAFEGRSEGKVVLAASVPTTGWIRMTVSDDGTGMDAGTLARVFDPFFTTRLGKGGSGLGLSVSYRIVTAILGGAISAQSTLGEGTCFTVMFPMQVRDPL